MTKRIGSGVLLAACVGLAVAIAQPAQAGGAHGGGGGIRAGHAGKGGWGGGWGRGGVGHRFVFTSRWGLGHNGWNGWNGRFGRNGWGNGRGNGWGWGNGWGNGGGLSYGGSVPYAASYGPGYGGGGPDLDYRSPSHPPVGILPSPVLPPAIYVIGGKGERTAPAAIRRSRAAGSRSAGIRAGEGGAAMVSRGGTDRRYRTN